MARRFRAVVVALTLAALAGCNAARAFTAPDDMTDAQAAAAADELDATKQAAAAAAVVIPQPYGLIAGLIVGGFVGAGLDRLARRAPQAPATKPGGRR